MTVGIICNTQTVAYDISSPNSCITVVSTSGQPSMPAHGYFEIAFAHRYQAALFSDELAAHLGVSEMGSLDVACVQSAQVQILVNYMELLDVALCSADECRVQVDFRCRVQRSALDTSTISARLDENFAKSTANNIAADLTRKLLSMAGCSAFKDATPDELTTVKQRATFQCIRYAALNNAFTAELILTGSPANRVERLSVTLLVRGSKTAGIARRNFMNLMRSSAIGCPVLLTENGVDIDKVDCTGGHEGDHEDVHREDSREYYVYALQKGCAAQIMQIITADNSGSSFDTHAMVIVKKVCNELLSALLSKGNM